MLSFQHERQASLITDIYTLSNKLFFFFSSPLTALDINLLKRLLSKYLYFYVYGASFQRDRRNHSLQSLALHGCVAGVRCLP